jgi:predicted esterase
VPPPATPHTTATTIHGRYCVRPADGSPAGLLVGFHGYAQNADICAADIDAIPGADAWLAVSVQGLHRFYTKAGDVVASWMTSQDRELAIADNVGYVRRVVAEVRATHPDVAGDVRPVFLGFSQGVAMAFRAATDFRDDAGGVIALGGDIPPEIRATSRRPPPVLIGRGTEDTRYPREKLATDVAWLTAMGAEFTVCEYNGGHVWTEAFRLEASRFLARLARPAAR